MLFTFNRYECSGKYFSDIDFVASIAVKYDLYTDGNLSGTIIMDERGTFAKFREGVAYRRRHKFSWLPDYEYILFNESEVPFAKIAINSPLLMDYLSLAFYDGSQTYRLSKRNFHYRKENASIIVEIGSEEKTVFMLKNTSKRKFFGHDSLRPMEGTIEMADDLHPDKVFGFLFAVQLYFETRD